MPTAGNVDLDKSGGGNNLKYNYEHKNNSKFSF